MQFLSIVFIFLFQHIFIDAEIDCSIYSKSIDIINFNPFYVELSSSQASFTAVTYFQNEDKVITFRIINDTDPSLNIYCLKDLQTLTLINTNLKILPDIKNLQNLGSLVIQTDNGIIDQHLPSEIGQLKALYLLTLNDTKNLEDLPDEIQYLTNMKHLTLEKIPKFKYIPNESIGKLTQLLTLKLIDLPNLLNLPLTINTFPKLSNLVLTNLGIKNLQLNNLNQLSDLTITSNSILSTIEITNMPALNSIAIRNNTELLKLKLENLSFLKTFTIQSASKLQTIVLNNLSQLNTLEISSSISLKNISFINLPLIKTLNLTGCQLTTFPQSILTLKSLENLYLSFNQLSSLPSTLPIDLPNLKILSLINNKFQGNIIQLPLINLRQLYLSNNTLTSIDGIQNYKLLEQLELDYNNISSISLDILKLSSTLRTLKITYNQLNTIPSYMTNMRLLNMIIVSHNNISMVERENIRKIFQRAPTRIIF